MQTVLNALRVLECVSELQPAGVTELARQLSLPKSTVQRSLLTLEEAGWIRPSGAGSTRWALTTRALTVGSRAVTDLAVRDLALPVMQRLRERLDETVHLVVPEGRSVVLVDRLDTSKSVRAFLPVGGRAPVHATSAGMAILSNLDFAEVRSLLDDDLTTYTSATITSVDALLDELEVVRERRWACNRSGWRNDVCGVAAAICGEHDRPVAAFSLSIPDSRFPADPAPLGEAVADAADEVSTLLNGRPTLRR